MVAFPDDGSVTVTERDGEDWLIVLWRESVNVVVTGATSFRGADPHVSNREILESVGSRAYARHRAEHIEDYQRLHGRVTLDLGGSDLSDKPTDERVAALSDGAKDRQLMETYFQFGRYLTYQLL